MYMYKYIQAWVGVRVPEYKYIYEYKDMYEYKYKFVYMYKYEYEYVWSYQKPIQSISQR